MPYFWPEALAGLVLLAPSAIIASQIGDAAIRRDLFAGAAGAAACGVATYLIVPNAASYLWKRGLRGRDFGKRGTPLETREMCVAAVAH